MTLTLAHLRNGLVAVATAGLLAACASLPPPTGELAAAQQAVARADQADADQHAADAITQARSALAQAQSAMSAGDDDDARRLALRAAATADLAHARSRAASARIAHAQRRAEVADLKARLGVDATDVPLPPEPAGLVGAHAARLQALAADPRLNGFAALERLQAQQAVDAVAAARSRDRPEAEALAERRVQAAETAAWAQAIERDAERLEREARDLQLEATRREAAEARAEADRLRMEAQLRAEEAERLRQQALEEEQARQQAEQALQGATSQQAARAEAARERERALARQEAEIVAGAKLPPSRAAGAGEVFTLAGDAFASGQSTLTAGAGASLRALAAYLELAADVRVEIVGHTDAQGAADANRQLSQRRAEAVRRALIDAGIPASRIRAEGRGAAEPVADNATAAGRARNRRVEIAVQPR